ncbi:hypothetical protein [uncultured Metabacillus sp.]|nr:hypothetical protein [uncultured Metabacillus sp.]
MSLGKFCSFLYKTARLLGDVNAARKGTLHKRLSNRAIKKLF